MANHPLAGTLPPEAMLVDVQALLRAYSDDTPDPTNADQRVSFGTSGHRGSSLKRSFNDAHIAAISQAISEYRATLGIDGPLFVGVDTHALSAPAQQTALEVLTANGVHAFVDARAGFTPTPVISHAILTYNCGRSEHLADGIVVTPSHNPPEDGGFKYNPPHGGPADTDATGWIERRANELLYAGSARAIKRLTPAGVRASECLHTHDFLAPYVADLASAIDMEAIAGSKIRLGADPLGGSNVAYWAPIAERYGLDITVVNARVDPTFRFMPLDHDGRIRMDCSSPFAMAELVKLKDRFDLAFGNDTDSDRHGIVTPSVGLMNPNHYLAVAIDYLLANRPGFPASAAIGKTLVSSAMIDRVTAAHGRRLAEVPVGFKWFVQGLLTGAMGFGGEESAGASFLRRDGSVWTTDKDGILLDLLAAEILAKTGSDPGVHYRALTERFSAPCYARIDAPANAAQKAILKKLTPDAVTTATLAGDPITARLTRAPGNDAAIGGLKVTTAFGWFAARPSGTEDVYKIYAESFRDEAHLQRVIAQAKTIVDAALGA